MREPLRVCIVVNPIAGSGQGRRRGEELEKGLAKEGCEVERLLTGAPGHATQLAREAARRGADVVVVCGGDGTVNEAVEGLAGTRTALAVMPIGLANVLGREMKLSESPRRVTEVVVRGRRRRLDLGRCGKHVFLCMAGIGFDAFVTQRLAEVRKGPVSYLSYIRPIWRSLVEYGWEALEVRVDGRALDVPVYSVVVGNTRGYGGPFTLTPLARPDDGRLDVCAFAERGKAWLTFYMVATAGQVHHRFRSVRYARGTRIEVQASRPVPVELDGDFKTYTPVSLELVPKGITVLSG